MNIKQAIRLLVSVLAFFLLWALLTLSHKAPLFHASQRPCVTANVTRIKPRGIVFVREFTPEKGLKSLSRFMGLT